MIALSLSDTDYLVTCNLEIEASINCIDAVLELGVADICHDNV